MLYPVLRDMNNWLDNDFDDMLNTSWMPRMNVTAPAINVKENDKATKLSLQPLAPQRMTSRLTLTRTVA